MSLQHSLRIQRTGAYTSVGHTAAQTAAALRSRLNNFSESAVFDGHGEPVWVAQADVSDGKADAVQRQLFMLDRAIADCLAGLPANTVKTLPIIYCMAKRPDEFDALAEACRPRTTAGAHYYARGASGLGHAFALATEWLDQAPQVLIASVDSHTTPVSLQGLLKEELALTASSGDGVVPGEAACALLVSQGDSDKVAGPTLDCVAFAVTGDDAVRGSNHPNLGTALSAAIVQVKSSLPDGQRIAVRMSDQAGDDWHAKQAALGAGRSDVGDAELWCVADSLGHCGAAMGALQIAWAHTALTKGYGPAGFWLAHQSSTHGQHSAMLLKATVP